MTDAITSCCFCRRPDTKPDLAAQYAQHHYELEHIVTQWSSS